MISGHGLDPLGTDAGATSACTPASPCVERSDPLRDCVRHDECAGCVDITEDTAHVEESGAHGTVGLPPCVRSALLLSDDEPGQRQPAKNVLQRLALIPGVEGDQPRNAASRQGRVTVEVASLCEQQPDLDTAVTDALAQLLDVETSRACYLRMNAAGVSESKHETPFRAAHSGEP